MRLRLRIKRHGLPITQMMWDVNDEGLSVSWLLGDIHHAIPLVGDGWGLEDYVVELGHFECLHYDIVGRVFKDLDTVE